MTLILENRKLPQLCAHLWQWNTLVPSFSSRQPVNSKRNTLYPKTNLRHLESRVVMLGLACCARSAAARFMRSSRWRWQIVEYLLHSTSCLYFPHLCFVSSLVHLLSAPDLSIRVSRVAADSAAFRSPVTQPVKLITVGPTAFTPPTHSHTHPLLRWLRQYIQTSYTPDNGAEWDCAPCCSLWSSEWWFRPKTAKTTSPANISSCSRLLRGLNRTQQIFVFLLKWCCCFQNSNIQNNQK